MPKDIKSYTPASVGVFIGSLHSVTPGDSERNNYQLQ